MPTFGERLAHAWSAFTSRDPTALYRRDFGQSSSRRPDRLRLLPGSERTIVNAIYNRIAIDVAAVKMVHAQLDQNDRFLETVDSGLNSCLNLEANIDQTGRAFIQDIVMSMLDEGCVALVPTETTLDPKISASYEILSMRVAKIVEWYPAHVKVRIYNEKTGRREELILPKATVAIIENPLYSVMNEPNSTLKRLVHKLALLDAVDEQSSSGKLDMIIQLPYVIKTEARRTQAEQRRKEIEMQLSGSKYGIAYTDGTEKITQLNRSLENNLLSQIEFLTSMLYGQLGLTEEIFKGTADEKTMLNYYNRTVEPILSAIADELKRKFLTKNARTRGQSIVFFRDPFKLVPVNDLAEIADKFTRNEILSSNEVRAIIGFKPVDDPKADELRNKNLNESEGQEFASTVEGPSMMGDTPPEEEIDPSVMEESPEEGSDPSMMEEPPMDEESEMEEPEDSGIGSMPVSQITQNTTGSDIANMPISEISSQPSGSEVANMPISEISPESSNVGDMPVSEILGDEEDVGSMPISELMRRINLQKKG